MTPDEIRQLIELEVRGIVREEIASLAGKALRRSQDVTLTRSPMHNEAEAAANRAIAHFWGEVLAEYGGQPDEASEK